MTQDARSRVRGVGDRPMTWVDEAYAAIRAVSAVTADELERHHCRAGRIHRPGLLYFAWSLGRITVETLRTHLGAAWAMAEFPDRALTRTAWRELAAAAGYTIDGRPASRPAGPLRLWRGSVVERRRDWSWTDDRQVAERFAGGNGRPPGVVWEVAAPPESLLWAYSERDECEHVVDTRGLKITPAE